MIRGTTPTLELTIEDEDLDLTQMDHVYVTLKNGLNVLTKKDTDLTISAQAVALYLNQAETLAMASDATEVQVNWTYSDGSRAATTIARVPISKQLLMEVVP